MPAASAEKRARQRANKLLRMGAETTAVSDIQPSAATDKITSGPLSTDYSTSFAVFISQAKLSDIKHFFEAIGSSQESTNLKIFWGRAFAEGKKAGQEEEYNRGYNAGYNEGYSEACEKDYEAGLATNASVSTAEFGTQVDHLPSPAPCIDISVQTTIDSPIQNSLLHGDISTQTSADFDPLNNAEAVDLLCTFSATAPSSTPLGLVWQRAFEAGSQTPQLHTISNDPIIPLRVDASIQATEPSPPVILPQKNPPHLDWAEVPKPLPITPTIPPSPCQPRDLSVLRSLSSSPFSSLQHRSKHFTHYSCQPRRHHACFNFNSSYSPHHNSFKPFQPYSHTKTYSHLNWESDPCLSDLSRSLKALGWIRAS